MPKWWPKYRAPLSFAVAFLGAAYLGFTGNPLGWGLAFLVLFGAAAYRSADRVARAVGPKGLAWIRRYTRQALVALALLAALYIVTQFALFALLAFIALLYLLAGELLPSSGSAREVRAGIEEAVVALAAAIAAWFLLSLALQTGSPLNVVTSCSMRPVLDRGDLILLQGGAVRAPVYLTDARLDQLRVTVERTDCLVNGERALCDGVLVVGDQRFPLSRENDILVFEPEPRITDLIIHRAALAIDAAGSRYYLTKGDNNQRVDQPALRPVRAERVQGKVLFRIPYAGYLKLLLFLQFDEPEGCRTEVRPL
jgi:hypothetical protein